MESIEIKIPNEVVKEKYLHPEDEGGFILILLNDMYTDAFVNQNGEYYTITNDSDLIKYINSNQ